MALEDGWRSPAPPASFSLLNLGLFEILMCCQNYVSEESQLCIPLLLIVLIILLQSLYCFKSPHALNVVGSLCCPWGLSLAMNIGFWFSFSTVFVLSALLSIEVEELTHHRVSISQEKLLVIAWDVPSFLRGRKWGNRPLLQALWSRWNRDSTISLYLRTVSLSPSADPLLSGFL